MWKYNGFAVSRLSRNLLDGRAEAELLAQEGTALIRTFRSLSLKTTTPRLHDYSQSRSLGSTESTMISVVHRPEVQLSFLSTVSTGHSLHFSRIAC